MVKIHTFSNIHQGKLGQNNLKIYNIIVDILIS